MTVVFFDITIGGAPAGRIEMTVRAYASPPFRLCTGTTKSSPPDVFPEATSGTSSVAVLGILTARLSPCGSPARLFQLPHVPSRRCQIAFRLPSPDEI